jgi:hypothetical protein
MPIKINRIRIDVATVDPQTWQVIFSDPAWPDTAVSWQPSHTMLRRECNGIFFPCVDPTDPGLIIKNGPLSPKLLAYCTGTDLSGLYELYQRIVSRSPDSAKQDVSTFGSYLFYVLIGNQIWAQILEHLKHYSPDLLELALAWPASEPDLYRYNWELMAGPDGFLAARQPQPPREIAITRLVKGANFSLQPIKETPRCLFAIGASLYSGDIRPGIEVLALLQKAEKGEYCLDSRLVCGDGGRGATAQEVEQGITAFCPHIVHFICHGEFEVGMPYLEFVTAEPQDDSRRNTHALAQMIMAGHPPPGIVVLGACNTAQDSGDVLMAGAHQTAPMAAGLVQEGIPVVVGMAGQVADSACRHFTRRFGESLFNGEPLVKAAADGRRVAHINSPDAEASVDWAFPAIFLAEGVDPSFTLISAQKDAVAELVAALIDKYNLADDVVFCSRLDFFQAYEKFFSPVHKPVLVAYVRKESGLGKSRLLKELASRAIRDGHIPVMLIHGGQASKYPTNLEELRRALADQLDRVAENYSLEGANWRILALRPNATGEIDSQSAVFPNSVRNYLENHNHRLTLYLIFWALGEDLNTLATQARLKHEYIQRKNGHAILLLDDVHLFGEEFLAGCFDLNEKLLTGSGLGKNDASIIPLIMTTSQDGAAAEVLKDPIQHPNSFPWLRILELKPFSTDGDEDLLAYEQIYLNPHDFNGNILPDISNRSLALNFAAQKKNPDKWQGWRPLFPTFIRGIPANFSTFHFYKLAESGKSLGNLLPANEVDELKKYMME